MSNIIVVIAEGDATPFLNPNFHLPKLITISGKVHTMYVRKWYRPANVNEVFIRDIDSEGTSNIPSAYKECFADYIRKTVMAFF